MKKELIDDVMQEVEGIGAMLENELPEEKMKVAECLFNALYHLMLSESV